MLCFSTMAIFAQKQGGIFSVTPDPIDPTQDAVVHYDGTGTNFANWTPQCHVHIWLVPKAGQTFTGNYDISWNSVDGDAQYAALEDKFKMTHVGPDNNGQYEMTLNVQNYFGVNQDDLEKIEKIGIIVRSQYPGDSNQTEDNFLNVAYTPPVVSEDTDNFAIFMKKTSDSEWSRYGMNKNEDNTFSVTVNMGREYDSYQLRVAYLYGTELPTAELGDLNTVVNASTIEGYGYGMTTFTVDPTSTASNWGITATGGEILPLLTYKVTVPEGTNRCYMIGEFSGWASPITMKCVAKNTFQVQLKGKATEQYKYLTKLNTDGTIDWEFQEAKEDGTDGDNRTWSETDVVGQWKTVGPTSENCTYQAVLNTTIASELGNEAVIEGVTTADELQNVSQIFGTTSPCKIIINAASDITLMDKIVLNCPKKINVTTSSVVYHREAMINGDWETILLPFDVNELPQGYEFEEFKGKATDSNGNSGLNFETVTTLKANIPYIMHYIAPAQGATESDTETVSFASDNVMTAIDATLPMVGTYEKVLIAEQTLGTDTKYSLNASASYFNLITENETPILPYRAYLNAGNIDNVSLTAQIKVLHNGESVVGITTTKDRNDCIITVIDHDMVITTTNQLSLQISTIDGKIIKNEVVKQGATIINDLPAGVYIVNRQKVIIK